VTTSATTARHLHELVEPIHLVTYFADEPTDELLALGLRSYWDGYFAGRSAPLGRVPAAVVHAVFYNFYEGEAARHLPQVWEVTTPEAALAARERGAVAALRRILGDLADSEGLATAAELATQAATGAPTEGRPLHAALRTLDVPDEPVARLWHAATLLREHRGDGHVATLVTERIGGTEAHVLHAVSQGIVGEEFGRVHQRPRQARAAVDRLRDRGLLDADGWLTDAGRALKDHVELRTDELAAAPYDALRDDRREELADALAPISARLVEARSR
jgi:hypothetical protein